MPDERPDLLDGLVLESTGSWLQVRVGDAVVPSRVRGRLRLAEETATNPFAVGDRVRLLMGEDGTGMIEEMLPRENALRRRAAGRRVGVEAVIAANVDRAWVVQSAALPRLNPGLGYPVVPTSTATGVGLEAWRAALEGRVSVLAGQSGVGKSSLLNAAAPALTLKTSAISLATRKGRHTTTHAALHGLPGGGYVIDTPGIREFGVVDVKPEELGFYFVEFKPYVNACRFQPCTHDHEPDCAVMAALDDGLITEQRFDSYLSILDSLRLGDRGR